MFLSPLLMLLQILLDFIFDFAATKRTKLAQPISWLKEGNSRASPEDGCHRSPRHSSSMDGGSVQLLHHGSRTVQQDAAPWRYGGVIGARVPAARSLWRRKKIRKEGKKENGQDMMAPSPPHNRFGILRLQDL